MCSVCIGKSHKFFNNKVGCWYCGDREIKVVTSNNGNEGNIIRDREESTQNHRRVIGDLNSIYDENGNYLIFGFL